MVAQCPPKKKKNILDIWYQGKIEYDPTKPIKLPDLDTRLIYLLGNPNEIKFEDKDNTIFTLYENGKENRPIKFKILAHKKEDNGFEGAIVKNLSTGENILWADGSKGITFDNLKNQFGELWKDWIINDLLGIGGGKIFPQLESLYNFANECMNNEDPSKRIKIDIGIGQSMMGVGMSALAFTDGFENIKFRTYSGCVQQELLDAIALRWGLNDKYGSNLESFFTPGEPLLNILQPVILNNKFYMKEFITNPCSKNPHSSDSYHNEDPLYDQDENGNTNYFLIEAFNADEFLLWGADYTLNVTREANGRGFSDYIYIHFNQNPKNDVAAIYIETLRELGVDVKGLVDENNVRYIFIQPISIYIKIFMHTYKLAGQLEHK